MKRFNGSQFGRWVCIPTFSPFPFSLSLWFFRDMLVEMPSIRAKIN
jgi:hypothetical protein